MDSYGVEFEYIQKVETYIEEYDMTFYTYDKFEIVVNEVDIDGIIPDQTAELGGNHIKTLYEFDFYDIVTGEKIDTVNLGEYIDVKIPVGENGRVGKFYYYWSNDGSGHCFDGYPVDYYDGYAHIYSTDSTCASTNNQVRVSDRIAVIDFEYEQVYDEETGITLSIPKGFTYDIFKNCKEDLTTDEDKQAWEEEESGTKIIDYTKDEIEWKTLADVGEVSCACYVEAYNNNLFYGINPATTITVPVKSENTLVYVVCGWSSDGYLYVKPVENAVCKDGYVTLTPSEYSFVDDELGIYDNTGMFLLVEPDITLGDVDGDGEVTILDATAVQMHIAKLKTLDAYQLLNADTDKDGEVSILDATQIQLYIAKLISEF